MTQAKNYENRSRFDKDMLKNRRLFISGHGVVKDP